MHMALASSDIALSPAMSLRNIINHKSILLLTDTIYRTLYIPRNPRGLYSELNLQAYLFASDLLDKPLVRKR
jgi:hypothetical protein